ncbi:MAG TPA: hypothetical protein VKA44_02755 [Gemmatimonadota bacterium]|nr:hypothetical protein [Gemmatimonadota bacterium]
MRGTDRDRTEAAARGGRRTAGRLAAAALLALALPVVMGAADHITPTVVLVKQVQVIKGTLPGAASFFLKTVQIGREDLTRLQSTGGFRPQSPTVKFYYGQDASGDATGVVLFPQVNSQHGPVEVGLTLDPDGTVRKVTVTKATVETKPWVEAAVATGFLDDFRGLAAGRSPEKALERLRSADLGRMPAWAGRQIATAVEHGLALYRVLYAPGSAGG